MESCDTNGCLRCLCKRLRQIEITLGQNVLQGIQAASINSAETLIHSEEAIPFDNILINQTSFLTLDTTAHTFTTTKTGNYLVVFYVNIDGTESKTEVVFSVNGVRAQAVSAVQGQMSGFALLSLNAGDTISLINASGETILISGSEMQAGITITSM